jgi:hypothetical protein
MIVWRKSSHSGSQGGSDCVEIAGLPGGTSRVIGVRDSKNPEGPMLALGRDGFRALLDQVKAET